MLGALTPDAWGAISESFSNTATPPPPITGNAECLPGPQWVPETAESTEPHIHCTCPVHTDLSPIL